MIDGLIVEKVSELQSEFRKRLQQQSPPLSYSVPSLLNEIIECDTDILDFTLGNIGLKLRQFALNVDFQHPEIVSIFDGIIANDQQFAQECMELLIIGKFAKEHKLNRIIPVLGKMFTRGYLNNNILRKIDTPQNNRMHVRLLKESKDREFVRMTKRMQIIDLQSVYRKGEEIWQVQPDSFAKFLRFASAYKDDLELAEKKAKRYDELGCKALADEVRKSIQNFKENIEMAYFGFNRITMTNAALILAKSLDYTMVLESNVYPNQIKVVINPKFFGKYNFNPNRVPQISNDGYSLFYQKHIDCYNYEPRVYPLYEFFDIMPDDIKKTVAYLESFPDAGNKPIFDHFGIIVPGVCFPLQNQNIYSFLDESGMIQSYTSREEAIKNLDKILTKGKYFHPIVVGERDGKCYFVCYWS